MKEKKEHAEARLCLNTEKPKIMTEEIHKFNTDNEDIEIVADLAYLGLVINLNGDGSQEFERRLRPKGQQWKIWEGSLRAMTCT